MSQLPIDQVHTDSSAKRAFARMIEAINRHDLDAMVACFAHDFDSQQPFHPERAFTGPEGVRNNWSRLFAQVPDMQADILSQAMDGDTQWAEIHFHGTQKDGVPFSIRGVTIQGVRGDRIAWARLYIETVQGAPLKQAVQLGIA